jgi:predicted O-linked N-acetylglucosamine transferase (SPINDLY family)
MHPSELIARVERRISAGDLELAEDECASASAAFPEHSALRVLLSAIRQRLGKVEQALLDLQEVLRREPLHQGALRARGILLALRGDHQSAIADLRIVAQARPEDASIQYDFGLVCDMAGDALFALRQYELALNLDPEFVPAALNRGYVLTKLGRLEQALENNLAVCERFPEMPEAHYNVAEVLIALRRPEPALEACDRAIELNPGYAKAHIDRALALAELGGVEQAQASLEQARLLDPSAMHAFNAGFAQSIGGGGFFEQFDARSLYLHRLYQQQEECDWRRRKEFIENLESLILDGQAQGRDIADAHLPFRALAFPISDAARLSLARGVARKLQAGVESIGHDVGDGGRIRIGYVSPDFRIHPAAFLTRRIYGLHDRARFEVFAYSLTPDDGSTIRRDIAKDVEHFRDVSTLSARQTATQIRNDGIHIAVDLSGYTNFTRPEVFAFRPAPIQVSYLGFPGTLGADYIQYALVDETVCPAGSEQWWTEKLIYMPDSYYVMDDRTTVASLTPRREDFGLPADVFVFCCLNNSYKIDPEVFDVWMRILARVPGSVLWLLGSTETLQNNLRKEAETRGVAGARIIFSPFFRREVHLARYALADLFLDTLNYNAHTTAVDALWMGVPVLTLPGSTMPARVGASLLESVGLPDMIVTNTQEYENKAVLLATDRNACSTLRQRLAENRTRFPLFDTEYFVRNLEQAYEVVWRRKVDGLEPESFKVSRVVRHRSMPSRWY